MFGIDFSEILLIAIVTLVVVGPERLPKVARTIGLLFGRAQRYVSEVKSDINRELKLEELRKLEAEMRDSARSMEHTMTDEVSSAGKEFKQVAEAVQPAALAAAPPPEAAAAVSSPQLELGLDHTKPEKSA
jgi:sec-independent protein translocase protein TatB